MVQKQDFEKLFPIAIDWVKAQEEYILQNGIPLNEDQQIDAYLVGVKEISKVRLWKGEEPPVPLPEILRTTAQLIRLSTSHTIGTSFRYGIYLHQDCSNQRNLVIHELAHTMQYERLGSIELFIKEYLNECLAVGYPNGALEQEARAIEKNIGNYKG